MKIRAFLFLFATIMVVIPFFQCHRYRLRFDQVARNRMREKVTASIIFKERKASYSRRYVGGGHERRGWRGVGYWGNLLKDNESFRVATSISFQIPNVCTFICSRFRPVSVGRLSETTLAFGATRHGRRP